jgi:hypothetical protein
MRRAVGQRKTLQAAGQSHPDGGLGTERRTAGEPSGVGHLKHALMGAPPERVGRYQHQREGGQVAQYGMGARRQPVEKAVCISYALKPQQGGANDG